jgi:HEAT repeat protein
MKKIYTEKRLKAVINSFLGEHKDTPFEAAVLITRMNRDLIDQAVELLSDAQANVRETACFIMGTQADVSDKAQLYCSEKFIEGVRLIENLLASDRKYSVRAVAANALGRIGLASTLPSLIKAASERSCNVRFAVAYALGSFYDWDDDLFTYKPAVTETLLKLMDDADEDVRDWATFGIHQGEHDTPETRARLWRALEDIDGDVRGEAAAALAKFNDRTFIPRLDELLRNDGPISPCYFEAAEEFGDPTLLPAVLVGAERWRKTLAEGEEMHYCIVSAIEVLTGRVAGSD